MTNEVHPAFTVTLNPGYVWTPVGKVEGLPICVVCGTPMLVCMAGPQVYAYCVECKEYYLPVMRAEAGSG